MMKILLLEDDVMLNEAICEFLQAQQYQVVNVGDGMQALSKALEEQFDLLILDITVPKLDGLSLLEELHRHKIKTPAIFISALVDIEDITRAFDLGCYDYLKKPFHLRELALRIDRVMNDTTMRQTSSLVNLGMHYRYDSDHKVLLYQDEPQVLTKRQYQIIDILANNLGTVIDFDRFRDEVWDEYVDNATIRAEVSRLKKTLREDLIQNIRAMGYMIDSVKR
jgi:DNA-binding response OmpR family regulator